jgi:hypothetical protein
MIMKSMILAVTLVAASVQQGCYDTSEKEESSSGVAAKRVSVQTDQNGWTTEQKNIAGRLKMDNTPGAIKHLYVISPMTGEVILYSTVMGKVTSSGKRLAPRTVSSMRSNGGDLYGMLVDINGKVKETTEVEEDDGTYGDSVQYIYWTDARGAYHQHFFTGGQIITLSDQPLPVHRIMINLETQEAK